MILNKYLEEIQSKDYQIRLLSKQEVTEIIKKYKDASSRFRSKSYSVYGLDKNSEIVGMIVVYNKYPDKMNKDFYNKLGYEIDITISFFYVDDKEKGKGYGNILIKHILNEYKNKRIGLTTNLGFTNKAAFHLYKKYGFEMIKNRGRTQFWYKEN